MNRGWNTKQICSQQAVPAPEVAYIFLRNAQHATIDNQAAMDNKLRRATEKCLVNYGFFVGATAENLQDLLEVKPACGIKIFSGRSRVVAAR